MSYTSYATFDRSNEQGKISDRSRVSTFGQHPVFTTTEVGQRIKRERSRDGSVIDCQKKIKSGTEAGEWDSNNASQQMLIK